MKYSNLILSLFIFIVIIELSIFTIPIKPSVILYFLIYMCSFIFIVLAIQNSEFNNSPNSSKILFRLYWLYSLIIIIYGFSVSDSYWDYKHIFISYIPFVIISMAIFAGLRFEQNLNLFKFIIKILFPLALFSSLFLWYRYPDAISRLGTPIFFFILAFPFLKLKHQLLVIIVSIVCIFVDLEWRTNVMRIIFCWLIVFLYYCSLLKPRLINVIALLIFPIPLILLYSGIEGTFDIFQLMSQSEVDLKIDKSNTRTFLFEEVFWSVKDSGVNPFFGGGASAGYQTTFFTDPYYIVSDKGRYAAEVAFLTSYLKSGIIGVIFDMLIFFIPAYFAINRSNNNFSRMLGFYLILSWILYFLEMSRTVNIYYFFFYFIVGICFAKSFRESADTEIKFFFKSV